MKSGTSEKNGPAGEAFHGGGPIVTGASEDLSGEIRLTVPREPGDIVRCTRVTDRHYRCNWWRSMFVSSLDNPGLKGGQLGTTYRVCKSSFYDAARTEEGTLRLTEVPARPRRARFG